MVSESVKSRNRYTERSAMKKIGILCAGDTELAAFFPYLKEDEVIEKAMLSFHCGRIHSVHVVLLYSGVCKVNAAIAAQLLIDQFAMDCILNAGTAGGIQEQVQLFDTVISERIAYHDVAHDILTEFHPWMDSVYFHADQELLRIAQGYGKTTENPVLFGTMVSGEQFVTDDNRAHILELFSPLCTDMETAVIAHVCFVNQLPFLAIRTITDTAEHSGVEEFEKNCEAASAIAAKITCDLLPLFAEL